MFALVYTLASLAASIASPAMPSASVTCATEPASCDGAWPAGPADDEADEAPRDYATPVEVDCPMVVNALAGQVFGEECEQTAPDLWYRVSREPTNPAGSMAPVRRNHAGSTASSCGAPAPDARHLTPPDLQPLALTALPVLGLDGAPVDLSRDAQAPPGRALAPLDRPPRV